MAKKEKTTKVEKQTTKKVSKKDVKKVSKKKNKKPNIFKRGFTFLKDVRKEMGKVRWPNRKEMLKYAGATLGFVLFFALFFLMTDGIIWALKQVMR